VTDSSRKATFQLFFETFGVAALTVAPTCQMGFVGVKGPESSDTALMVNLGDQVTSVVPIVDGVSYKEHMISSPVGGASVSDFLGRLLAPSGLRFDSAALARELIGVKERFGAVAVSPADPRLTTAPSMEYVLPDGTALRMQVRCMGVVCDLWCEGARACVTMV
jgi:hypothetical protein